MKQTSPSQHPSPESDSQIRLHSQLRWPEAKLLARARELAQSVKTAPNGQAILASKLESLMSQAHWTSDEFSEALCSNVLARVAKLGTCH